MAIKAFFALALVLAATIGLLLPTGASKSQPPAKSSFQTIELKHG
jgi:hypothetical protein